MLMGPGLRKFALTAHIACSVGTLGAVASFLVLAIAGFAGNDSARALDAYPAMALVAAYVVAPLVAASLLTGVVQSLGTRWGLFRHYWVIAKLVVTLVVAVVLLLQLDSIGFLAAWARSEGSLHPDIRAARLSPILHAGGGLLVLLIPVALSLFKPKGLTRHGWREQNKLRS